MSIGKLQLLKRASLGGACLILLVFSLTAAKATAASIPYNPADLISDNIFANKSAMGDGSAATTAIQNFLQTEGSGLAKYHEVANCSSNPSYMASYYRCGQSESAAEIINDAAHAYGINPHVILATLQKEQSLITTPDPTSSQLQHATGYGCPDSSSCNSTYYGFFNQVDWGTWQFRADVELMSGRTYMGIAPSSYSCSNASVYYSTGLYPGRAVTFMDDNGVSYRTLTLIDAATAALYCYTPHTYNNPQGYYNLPQWGNTGQYYSGSYNFVTSYQKWFGSTVYDYAADTTVTTYSDAARTQPLSLSGPFPSGKVIYVTVSALNTGSKTWSNSFTRVATENPNNRQSVFSDASWLASNRPARLDQASVAPGQTGTFEFSIATPSTDGAYSEGFGLVADGQDHGWMQDNASFGFDVTVSNPYNGTVAQLSTYRDSNYSQLTDPSVVAYGQKVYVRLKVKNTGTQTWSNSFTKVATENPNNRTSSFHDSSWPETNRPAYLQEPSVAPGQTGTFTFSLTAPSTASTYYESFGLVAEGQSSGWMPAPKFTMAIRTVPGPLSTLYPGFRLYSGQAIHSPDGKFTTVLQSDGNLVIYSPHGALWASGTDHTIPGDLVMQGDGNLVLYDGNGRPVWASGTAHRGTSNAVMQYDGNFVIYSSSGASWASGSVDPTWRANATNSISSGTRLALGQSLHSDNRSYTLIMQGDGNLVLYGPRGATWATGTNGKGVTNTVLQGDGNLVLYDGNGRPVWASGTNGKGSSTLLLGDDGSLHLFDSHDHLAWAAATR